MRGLRIFIASLLCCAGTRAYAQQPDYFPLGPGNVWVYRCVGACGSQSAVTVQLGAAKQFNGTTYWQLLGWLGSDYWVREDENGNVFSYDPAANVEKLWYAFGSAEGSTYDESLPACCGKATVRSKSAHYQGPLGTFDYALEIQYPGVFQVGVFRELFLPYIGLISREQAAGGPAIRIYDLIYARVGGVTVVSQPELSVGLALDHAVYEVKNNPVLNARLNIRNSTNEALTLTFPSSQVYDLDIRDEKGVVVFQWSADKGFAQVITTVELQDEKNYVISAPLAGLPPGSYVAQAWFTTTGPPRAYSGSAAFQIK